MPSRNADVITSGGQASLLNSVAVKRYALLNIGHVLSRAALLVTTVYLGRVLGIRSFGVVVYFQSAATLLAMATDCGLAWQGSHHLARAYAQRGSKVELMQTFNRIASLRLALASLFCLGWWLATYRSEFSAAHRWLLLTFASSLFVSAVVPEWVLIAVGQTTAVVLGR